MFYEIKLGTVTRAQHSIYVLKKYGIKATIGRVKNPKRNEGCGYTIRVNTDNINFVIQLLNENGIANYGVDGA